MTKKIPLKLGLWGPLFLSIFTASTLTADITDTVEESFSTESPGLFSLDLRSTKVEIDTHDGSDVTIAIERTLRRGDREDFEEALKKIDLTFEQTGNNIRCELKYNAGRGPSSWFSGRKNRLSFRAIVKLPREFNVDTRTTGGSIDIKNLIGDTLVRTSGGGIRLENIVGSINSKTSGGGINATNCEGPVELKTSGGSISTDNILGSLIGHTSGGKITGTTIAGNATLSTSGGSITLGKVTGNLNASTSGGSIRATLVGQLTEDCLLKTSGGSINVTVDPTANLQIDASANGGGVTSKLALSNFEAKRSSMKGQLNNGGPELKARTSGGSIHINSI